MKRIILLMYGHPYNWLQSSGVILHELMHYAVLVLFKIPHKEIITNGSVGFEITTTNEFNKSNKCKLIFCCLAPLLLFIVLVYPVFVFIRIDINNIEFIVLQCLVLYNYMLLLPSIQDWKSVYKILIL